MNTKFSKTFITDFFPVGDSIRATVVEWVEYLKTDELFGMDDPLFPKTKMVQNEQRNFMPSGVLRECWSTANPIRTIFKDAFMAADLQYFKPHSFRKTLVTLSSQFCITPEDFKAWSQNLGHENVLTTFTSYGEVQPQRQAEIFKQLRDNGKRVPSQGMGPEVDYIAEAVVKKMEQLEKNKK